MKHLVAIVASLVMSLAMVAPVEAKECRSIYGGGESCDKGNIEVTKEIWDPKSGSWLDGNLNSDYYTFSAGNEVKYRFIVQNPSDIKVTDIKVEDKLPTDFGKYMEYAWADSNGHWDGGNNTVWFDHFDLDEHSTKYLQVTLRFRGESDLPNGVTCIPDRVEVRGDDDFDSDDSSACVKKGTSTTTTTQVLGVTTLPSTGPALPVVLALEVLGFAGMGAAYVSVSRKAKK